MIDRAAVAKRIRVYRAENDMTQQDLASVIGISRDSVIKYENAEVGMTLETAGKMASVFGCSLDELANREPSLSVVHTKPAGEQS